MTDRQMFFKRYIRLEFDNSSSPALIEWSLYHEILEVYYNSRKDWTEFNFEETFNEKVEQFTVDNRFDWCDWGKTWSLDKSLKTVKQAIWFYFNELPEYDEILDVEKKLFSEFCDLEWNEMPIPLKWFCDVIVKNWDDIIIVDHKTVWRPIPQDDFAPWYEIQAMAYWFLVRQEYWKNPTKMIFDQLKKTKNRDWSPQLTQYVIEYTPELLNRFLELYKRIVKELSGQPLIDETTGLVQFIPNPFGMFGWEDTWNDFCEEVIEEKKYTIDELHEIKKSKFRDIEPIEL